MKNKVKTLLIALAVSLGTVFAASGTCGDNLTWDLTNGVLTISGSGDMTNWSSSSDVPWYSYRANIKSIAIGNSVTSIGDRAFYQCLGLTNVTIPNSITSIGGNAFRDCDGLTSITIPDGVTSIGDYAFCDCDGLMSVTFGGGVTSIGNGAFAICFGLTSVTIPNSVTSIGEGAFSSCDGLSSVTIGNSVTSIGDEVFYGCSSLTSMVVENGNTVYDSRNNCNAIIETATNTLILGCKNTIIPNSVTSIGESAFELCTGLTSITIPNGVTSIGGNAFQDCYGLTSITIANSVTSIGESAFYYCSGLKHMYVEWEEPISILGDVFDDVALSEVNLHIPCRTRTAYQTADVWKDFGSITEGIASGTCGAQGDNLTWNICNSILTIKGTGAMANYTSSSPAPWYSHISNIKDVVIEENVTSIGNYAFSGCTSLTSVTISNSVSSIGSYAFSSCKNLTSIELPHSVINVGNAAFNACTGLTSLIFSKSITSLESSVCAGCTGLTSITIPESVANIKSSAFKGCSGLTSVVIPSAVESLGYMAFAYCSNLTSVVIPNSIIEMGQKIFYQCSQLTDVYVNWRIPISITAGVFTSQRSLHVPCGTLTAYQTENIWKDFETFTEENTSISGSCGSDGNNLTWSFSCGDSTLVISGVGAMQDYARADSVPWNSFKTKIANIIISYGITNIGSYAFFKCGNLKSLEIPSSVTNIGNAAFYSCTGLTSIEIPNSVTSIGNSAFRYCSGLMRMVVESGNSVYDSRNNCNAIIETASNTLIVGCKNTIIPDDITSIGNDRNYAFSGCTGLTSITIPDGVINIGSFAFNGCSELTSINIPNSVTSIGPRAFQRCSSLTNVYVKHTMPLLIDSTTFIAIPLDSANLHVPCGTVATYRAADVWKNFGNIIGDSCTYVITWKDYNGTILDKDTIPEGAMPVYTGEIPNRPATAQYTYEFNGWRPDLQYAFCDTTYVAQYTSTRRKYCMTFVNYDGSVLYTDTVNAGATAKFQGETPSRPNTERCRYFFTGWTPTTTTILENVTYTAEYDSILCKSCTINYYNSDSLLQSKQTTTCAFPKDEYDGPTPTSCDTASTYFMGWTTTQYSQKQTSIVDVTPISLMHFIITSKEWKDTNHAWTSIQDGYDYLVDRNGLQITGGYHASAISKQYFTNVDWVEVIYCTNTEGGYGTVTISINGTSLSHNTSGIGHTHRSLIYHFDTELPSGQVQIDANATSNSIYICEIIIHTKYLYDETDEPENNYYALFCKREMSTTSSSLTFSSADFSGTGTAGTGSELSSTKDSITLYLDKGYAGNPLRSYADGNLVFSSTAEPLQKIVIRTNTKKGNANNLTLVSGGTGYSIQRDSLYVIWEGNSKMVKFHTAAHVQFAEISVTTGVYQYVDFMTNCPKVYNVDVSIPDTIDSHGTVIVDGEPTYGDTITLTANPEDGYYFDSWSDGNTDNPREIVVTEDINVYPIFKKCEEVIFTFSEVITKGDSFEFAGMSLSQKGTYSDTTVLANGCDSITILKLNVVKPKTFNLRVVVNDETMGTVEGAGTYTQGQQVTITATPVSNKYVFVRWYNEDEDINIYDNPYTFELNRNLQIRAVFRRGKK